jgi:uncharacterized protein
MLRLLQRVKEAGLVAGRGTNLIAFSGGIDSSVVAAAVFKVFPQNALCVLGRSSSLPAEQLDLARSVSRHIGIPLREVFTKEGTSEQYIQNEGMSCYSCKSHLYQALRDIQIEIVAENRRGERPGLAGIDTGTGISLGGTDGGLTLFNGTNKDDKVDVTRVGLIAASEFSVASPLDEFTKMEVRAMAREFGLPNHAHAASPCLRSRLAFGVNATPENLLRIESAEREVKAFLSPGVEMNIRVRHMQDGSASIELDERLLEENQELLPDLAERVTVCGFSTVRFRPFRSGSLAAIKLQL